MLTAGTCSGTGTCNLGATTSCGAFACNAGGTACLTSCVSDMDCSSGNICFAGTCTVGPVTLASVSSQECVHDLAIDANDVYWVTAATTSGCDNNIGPGGLYKCSKTTGCGTAPTEVYATTNGSGIALDVLGVQWGTLVAAQNVYWTEYANTNNALVLGCPASASCGTAVTFSGTSETGSNYIAADGSRIYWTDDNTSSTVVRWCASSSAANCQGTLQTLGSPEPGSHIAVDATNVYWSDLGDIRTSSISSPGATVLVSGLSYAIGIAVDANNLYYGQDTGTVSSCPKGNCSSQTVLWQGTSGVIVRDLAVDTQNVYWITDDGLIRRCAIGGCAMMPKTLTSGQTSSQRIAVDEKAIYWSTGSNIMKMAKYPVSAIASERGKVTESSMGLTAGAGDEVGVDEVGP